jgi:hypothetical protein
MAAAPVKDAALADRELLADVVAFKQHFYPRGWASDSRNAPPRIASSRCFATNCGYRYLGDWTDRAGNSNIDEGLLTAYLSGAGYTAAQISRALDVLRREADNHGRTLYGNNQAVYSLLRYGVQVKTEAGQVTDTVHLIDWREPEQTTSPGRGSDAARAGTSAGPISCST